MFDRLGDRCWKRFGRKISVTVKWAKNHATGEIAVQLTVEGHRLMHLPCNNSAVEYVVFDGQQTFDQQAFRSSPIHWLNRNPKINSFWIKTENGVLRTTIGLHTLGLVSPDLWDLLDCISDRYAPYRISDRIGTVREPKNGNISRDKVSFDMPYAYLRRIRKQVARVAIAVQNNPTRGKQETAWPISLDEGGMDLMDTIFETV